MISTGLDELSPELLKDAAATISLLLKHIINLSLETDAFSTQWKKCKNCSSSQVGFIQYLALKTLCQCQYYQFCLKLSKNRFISSSSGSMMKLTCSLSFNLVIDQGWCIHLVVPNKYRSLIIFQTCTFSFKRKYFWPSIEIFLVFFMVSVSSHS